MKGIKKNTLILTVSFLTACGLIPLLASCKPAVTTPSTAQIETKVRSILELHTFEYTYRDIIFEKDPGFWANVADPLLGTSRPLLFSIDIKVRGGLDFKGGIEVRLFENSPEKILVSHRKPEILLVDADEESIFEFFGVPNNYPQSGYLEKIQKAKDFAEADAIKRGILVKAEEKARTGITGFLGILGYTDVYFEHLPEKELEG